jgi:hypothetical protein
MARSPGRSTQQAILLAGSPTAYQLTASHRLDRVVADNISASDGPLALLFNTAQPAGLSEHN